MNTKKTRRVVAMVDAVNAKLPCDTYGSLDEWRQRFAERLKDGGYTPDEITARMADTLQRADLRARARAELDGILAKRSNEDTKSLLLEITRRTQLFTSLKPGRDFARLVKHLNYFGKRSLRIREAYLGLFRHLRENVNNTGVQALLSHNIKAADRFAQHYGCRLWSLRPDDPVMFYERSSFLRCDRTNLEMPSNAGLRVICNEDGRAQLVHPSMADDPNVVRDPISGFLVFRDAVEWATLDTGEQFWKRHNVTIGAVAWDDDEEHWVRCGRGAMGSYHGARRDWRTRDQSRYRGCIGVELEVGFKSSVQLTKFLNRFVDSNGRFTAERPFLIERDSSLSGITGGSEIISEPLPLYEGYQAPNAPWRWLLEQLVKGGAEGWKHRHAAGIHVNLDVSDKKPNQIVRFVAFINNAASLSRFISGRRAIFGHNRSTGELTDNDVSNFKQFLDADKNEASGGYGRITKQTLEARLGSSTFNSQALSWLRQNGKYQPVHVRSNTLLEVRIFGSNIRYEGFMACVEYCVAGMAFVCQLENDEAVFDANIGEQFRTWLSRNVTTYPNLSARIGVEEASEPVVARPLVELVA